MVRVVVGMLAIGFIIGACAGRKIVDNGGIIGEGEGEGAAVVGEGEGAHVGEGEGMTAGEGEGSR
jgi:hypothetical protein